MSGLPEAVVLHAAQKARQFEVAMAAYQGEQIDDAGDDDAFLSTMHSSDLAKRARVRGILEAIALWQSEPVVRNRHRHYVTLLHEWSHE
jgi:hypothetical protein